MLPNNSLKPKQVDYDSFGFRLPENYFHYGILKYNFENEIQPYFDLDLEYLNLVEEDTDRAGISNVDETEIQIELFKYTVYGFEIIHNYKVKFLICPMQSGPLIDEDNLFHENIDLELLEANRLYMINDSISVTKIYPIRKENTDPIEAVYFCYKSCKKKFCELWDNRNRRCGQKTSDLWYDLVVGHAEKIPYAILLMNEFLGNEDLDGNDLIYGFDFYVLDDVKPALLKTIEGNSRFSIENLPVYNWQQYLDTLEE